jgi:two-component system cell cycle sensor histidine kinase/response regulator CckA
MASSPVVLLVDDDANVRLVVEDILDELGFVVIAVESGEEGLSRLPGLSRLDLLVTDVLMPSMDGWTFAERVRAAHPNLPVLYITGYFGDGARPVEGGRVINKPFAAKDLAAQVADVV